MRLTSASLVCNFVSQIKQLPKSFQSRRNTIKIKLMKLAFDPVKHGWHFSTNIIADAMGVKRNNGLSGGMSLAAVNYFRYGLDIPPIGYYEFKKANKAVKNARVLAGVMMSTRFSILYSTASLRFSKAHIL